MDLSLFCDTYIIAEYLRLNRIIKNGPRYTAGKQHGIQVISSYYGYGKDTSRRVTRAGSKYYAEVQKQFFQYSMVSRKHSLYQEELRRRNLPIPEDFNLRQDTSAYNINTWNQLIPCSNNHVINTMYHDDFGFNVRTRGELIIGNSLMSLGLDAKYEPLLLLNGVIKKNPDYSFPVHIIDRCFFIEFMGMADDEGYIESNYGKIEDYMRGGILPNRDLILICGTRNWIPEQESIKRIIAAFINNAVLSIYNRKE